MTRILYRLAHWSASHGALILTIWVLLLVGVTVADKVIPPPGQQDFSLAGTDSAEALELLSRAFPGTASDPNPLVLASKDPLNTGSGLATLEKVESAVSGIDGVAKVAGPQDNPGQYSSDATTALIQVTVTDRYVGDPTIAQQILDTATAAAPDDQVALGGLLGAAISTPNTETSEVLGLIAAVIVLLLALRRAWAAAIPLINAIVTVGIGIALIDLLGRLVLIPGIAPTLGTMLGLGVGIDYALFLVTRHRTLLQRGYGVADSAGRTAGTSGAGIVFAGSTLILAVCGLALTGISFLAWMGIAAAIVVLVAVIASTTLVPAILGLLGSRVLPKKHHHVELTGDDHLDRGMWAKIADSVTGKPWLYTIVSLVLLLTLAAPMATMTFGQTDASDLPPSTTSYQANELMVEAFGPGSTGPLAVVVQMNRAAAAPSGATSDGGDPRTQDPRLQSLQQSLAGTSGIESTSAPIVSPDGGVAVVSVTPATGPADPETQDLINSLRSTILPRSTEGEDMEPHVGGSTALFMDLTDVIGERLPYFIIGVASLSAILLLVAYRSLIIPLKAAAMNILSICAAYGVVVAVFEWGWGASLIGLDKLVPIETFVPMMMFAVLFGLSMDYEVFLLTAFREHWDRTGDMTTAVRRGLTDTGRVVTSAATIMVVVFASFILVDDAVTKMFGVGLATAVLVDATIVRCLLVPALMVLAAKWTWWLPRWLDRALPELHVEGDPEDLETILAEPPSDTFRSVEAATRPAVPLWIGLAGVAVGWFFGSRLSDPATAPAFADVAIVASAVVGGLIVWLPRGMPGAGRRPGVRVLSVLIGAGLAALVFGILRGAVPFTSQQPGLFAAAGVLAVVALVVLVPPMRTYGLPILLGAIVMAVSLGVGATDIGTNFAVLLRNALFPAFLAGLFALFIARIWGDTDDGAPPAAQPPDESADMRPEPESAEVAQ